MSVKDRDDIPHKCKEFSVNIPFLNYFFPFGNTKIEMLALVVEIGSQKFSLHTISYIFRNYRICSIVIEAVTSVSRASRLEMF